MTRSLRRDGLFAGALGLCIGAYAVAGSVPWAGPVLGLAALGVVVLHVVGADEVRRLTAYRAGFFAYIVAAGVTLGATLTGRAEALVASPRELWAWLFGLYLVCWVVGLLARR